MEMHIGIPFDINVVNKNVNDIVLDIRYSLKVPEGADLRQHLQDTLMDVGLLLLGSDLSLKSKDRFIYYGNPQLTTDKFTIIEDLSQQFLVDIGEPLKYKYNNASRVYTSEPTQFRIILDEIPEDVEYVYVVAGLNRCEETDMRLKAIQDIKVTIINSGLTKPAPISHININNYFIDEQSAVLGYLRRTRGLYSFTPNPIGSIGNVANIVHRHLTIGSMQILMD